jgi:hypothetical protein
MHHDVVHISAAEAALAASAITALAGIVGPAAIQRAARRAAHTGRLWERRVEAYDFVIADAQRWQELRERAMAATWQGDTGVIEPPKSFARRYNRLRRQLQMFGEEDVRRAYERAIAADQHFLATFFCWRHAMLQAGDTPAGDQELRHYVTGVEAAGSNADARDRELVAVIHEAARRIPRIGRPRILPHR